MIVDSWLRHSNQWRNFLTVRSVTQLPHISARRILLQGRPIYCCSIFHHSDDHSSEWNICFVCFHFHRFSDSNNKVFPSLSRRHDRHQQSAAPKAPLSQPDRESRLASRAKLRKLHEQKHIRDTEKQFQVLYSVRVYYVSRRSHLAVKYSWELMPENSFTTSSSHIPSRFEIKLDNSRARSTFALERSGAWLWWSNR